MHPYQKDQSVLGVHKSLFKVKYSFILHLFNIILKKTLKTVRLERTQALWLNKIVYNYLKAAVLQ